MKAEDAMATVVATMIQQIEDGADTWTMPWNTLSTLPRNGVTGANYRGGNVMSLLCTQLQRDYTSLEWATYKQWQSVDAQVTKGAKAAWIIVWKPIEKVVDGELTKRLFARAYPVFNRDVVEGAPPAPEPERTPARQFFGAVPAHYREGPPSYSPTHDIVFMPDWEEFWSIDHYDSVLAHELAHWTGHPTRLNREQKGRLIIAEYAIEELIAELSSAFTIHTLQTEAGTDLLPAARMDHAPYLKSWIGALKEKPSILWSVASKAQAATDHLRSYSLQVAATAEGTTDVTASELTPESV